MFRTRRARRYVAIAAAAVVWVLFHAWVYGPFSWTTAFMVVGLPVATVLVIAMAFAIVSWIYRGEP